MNTLTVALLGNPNTGKSSLFNHLTGLQQKIGNFPGVTVDKKSGRCQLDADHRAVVVDLPGTYSLYPKSLDERVVFDTLSRPDSDDYPDRAVVVADLTNLKRHLLLFTQLRDLGLPVVLALNMGDVAQKRGIRLNDQRLAADLGVPVVRINGRTGAGISDLKQALLRVAPRDFSPFYEPPADMRPLVAEVRRQLRLPNDYLAWQYVQQGDQISSLSLRQRQKLHDARTQFPDLQPTAYRAAEVMQRYQVLDRLLQPCLHQPPPNAEASFTARADRILTHPLWGYSIFLLILLLMFQAIFAWAEYPMDLIDGGIAQLNGWLLDVLPAGPLTELLTEGVIAGLGGILIFIPQIALLFAFIALLEESGYMARVVYLMDRLMRQFGLNGRSVVPLISGVACAVPAVLSARTIENWKERLITIFVTPLMSCSARIPVYTILIALVVPEQRVLGVLNLQGLVLMGLYSLGFGAALLSALAMKFILRSRERSFLMMEMPTYQVPRWKNAGLTILEKVRTFVWEAGRVILAISVVLWVLASYGPGNRMEQAEAQVRARSVDSSEDTERRVAAARLEYSYVGHLGRAIEPAIRPLGFDWKIGIALVTSFAAREVFVGTMATIYSVGADLENDSGIRERMRSEINPDTGGPRYDPATAFSLLIFYAFAMQCMSTLAVVKRETKGWKWPLLQLAYMTGLAYLSSLVVYQVLS